MPGFQRSALEPRTVLMKCAYFSRWLTLLIASAVLASCSGLTTQPIAPAAGAQSVFAKSESLLYLSNVRANDVEVYSYPTGGMVGKLTDFGKPRSECVDPQGDVWIADTVALAVLEYPHGGQNPIAALSTPGAPNGCAASPVGRFLAVAGGLRGTVVTVWQHVNGHWQEPREYTDKAMRVGYFCGYDANANLFIDGSSATHNGSFRLAELPRHGSALVNISLTQKIVTAGQVQWDGQTLAIGDTGVKPSVVYRFTISGTHAKRVGTTTLDGTTSVRQFWIDGTQIIGPDFASRVGLWKYPQGGKATQTIDVPGFGAAVSK